MIENGSKYPAHLTPPRFPLVIVRASVTAPMKVTPTSRVKMAFELAWDQAPPWGKKAKNGVKQEKYRSPSGCLAPFSPSQNTSRLTSPGSFFSFRPR